jgi:hypothetical protein
MHPVRHRRAYRGTVQKVFYVKESPTFSGEWVMGAERPL